MYRCVSVVVVRGVSLEKSVDVARRRQSSYDVARLHLTSPLDFWRNSIPFFCAVALCTMKIDDFRATRDIDEDVDEFGEVKIILYIRIEIN